MILKDPAVESLSSFIGVDGTNTTLNSGRIQINLKPLEDRKINASDVIRRLQPELEKVDGITLYMQPVQDLTVEDRVSRTQFQYTLEDPDANELNRLDRKLVAKAETDCRNCAMCHRPAERRAGGIPGDRPRDGFAHWESRRRRSIKRCMTRLASAKSPRFIRNSINTTWFWKRCRTFKQILRSCTIFMFARRCVGVSSVLGLERTSASTSLRLIIRNAYSRPDHTETMSSRALEPAFECQFRFVESGAGLTAPNGAAVPLSTFTHFESRTAPLAINHQGQFPVVTISFNLAPDASLGEATKAIDKAQKEIKMPLSVQAAFQGTAASFQASLANEPLLILAALVTVYIVLGVLYESYIHPDHDSVHAAVCRSRSDSGFADLPARN